MIADIDLSTLTDAELLALATKPASLTGEGQLQAVPDNPFVKSLSMSELLAMPPKQWLAEGLFGDGDLVMFYGGSGSGKTFVVIDLIGEMCSGGDFAGQFKINKPLNIAYCAGEGVSGLAGRFKAMMDRKGLRDLHNFRLWTQAPQLAADRNGQRTDGNIRQFIDAYQEAAGRGELAKLDVLIVDTLHSATAGADENSAGDMGRVIESCREAIRLLGCTVILVHHTGKNGDSERGSSALRGAMDCMVHIKRISDDDTKAVMSCTKLKDGETWKQQTFDLVTQGESVSVWWDEPADGTETGKQDGDKKEIVDVLRKTGAPLTAKQIAQAIGKGESNHIYALLKRLCTDGLVVSELRTSGSKPSNSNPWLYSACVSV